MHNYQLWAVQDGLLVLNNAATNEAKKYEAELIKTSSSKNERKYNLIYYTEFGYK